MNVLLLQLGLWARAASEDGDTARMKVEKLTVWMVSRILFAVWNTVAARPIAPVAIPNASAAIIWDTIRLEYVQRRSMLVIVEGGFRRRTRATGVFPASGLSARLLGGHSRSLSS